ncbi:hypothetical protein Tco_0543795, partial [Tanacetum coccineum]
MYRDRPVHRRLAVMIEREAKIAREAWGLSMDASDYARLDVMSLRTTLVAQSALILELQSADHKRITELLASDHKRQVQLIKTLRLLKGLQTQMVEFQRQHGPAEGLSQPDASGEGGEVLELVMCVAMLCSLLSIYGLFPKLADCIDLLFCLVTSIGLLFWKYLPCSHTKITGYIPASMAL